MRTSDASNGSSAVVGEPRERRERALGERLAEDGGVLEHTPLLRRQAVEARSDERVQRLRNLERVDLRRGPVDGALLDEQSAVEEHPHRLHRVERDALGALEDLAAHLLGQARHETRSNSSIAPAGSGSR